MQLDDILANWVAAVESRAEIPEPVRRVLLDSAEHADENAVTELARVLDDERSRRTLVQLTDLARNNAQRRGLVALIRRWKDDEMEALVEIPALYDLASVPALQDRLNRERPHERIYVVIPSGNDDVELAEMAQALATRHGDPSEHIVVVPPLDGDLYTRVVTATPRPDVETLFRAATDQTKVYIIAHGRQDGSLARLSDVGVSGHRLFELLQDRGLTTMKTLEAISCHGAGPLASGAPGWVAEFHQAMLEAGIYREATGYSMILGMSTDIAEGMLGAKFPVPEPGQQDEYKVPMSAVVYYPSAENPRDQRRRFIDYSSVHDGRVYLYFRSDLASPVDDEHMRSITRRHGKSAEPPSEYVHYVRVDESGVVSYLPGVRPVSVLEYDLAHLTPESELVVAGDVPFQYGRRPQGGKLLAFLVDHGFAAPCKVDVLLRNGAGDSFVDDAGVVPLRWPNSLAYEFQRAAADAGLNCRTVGRLGELWIDPIGAKLGRVPSGRLQGRIAGSKVEFSTDPNSGQVAATFLPFGKNRRMEREHNLAERIVEHISSMSSQRSADGAGLSDADKHLLRTRCLQLDGQGLKTLHRSLGKARVSALQPAGTGDAQSCRQVLLSMAELVKDLICLPGPDGRLPKILHAAAVLDRSAHLTHMQQPKLLESPWSTMVNLCQTAGVKVGETDMDKASSGLEPNGTRPVPHLRRRDVTQEMLPPARGNPRHGVP